MDYLREHDPASLNLLARKKNISEVCTNATDECAMAPWAAYQSLPSERARGWFDIAHPKHDPFPPPHYLGYLRQAHVQVSIYLMLLIPTLPTYLLIYLPKLYIVL